MRMQMDVEGSRGVKTATCKWRTEASEEAACPHLELGLPASRTVSKYFCPLRLPACDPSTQQPQRTKTPLSAAERLCEELWNDSC